MTILFYDVLDDLKKAVDDQWGNTGDGGPKPRVVGIWEEKITGLPDNADIILVSPIDEDIKPFQLHGDVWMFEIFISVDIRTYSTLTRHRQIVNEMARILRNILRRDSTGFLDVILTGSKSYNEDYRNIYRHVYKLRYRATRTHTFV